MQLLNDWSPLTATFEELEDMFLPCSIEKMEELLQIGIDMEQYLYAEKVKRILDMKREDPEQYIRDNPKYKINRWPPE